MNTATFHFFADLNDFLLPSQRGTSFSYPFTGEPAVKHLIEAIGVPHPEVGRLYVNGEEQTLRYHVRDGDQIQVYPASAHQVTETAPTELDSNPDHPGFILDTHLGKLAVYLRILGFDVLYRNDYDDSEIASLASQQNRILLTRDRHLLMRSLVQLGYCVRALEPRQQVIEIMHRFNLADSIQPFRRCLRCNAELEHVEKEQIIDQLEPLTRKYYDEFHRCTRCGQVYWKGSHYEHMSQFIEQLLEVFQ